MTKLKCFLCIATSHLGIKETGNNDTIYGKFTGYNNVSWCMMFVYYCLTFAGSCFPKTINGYPYLYCNVQQCFNYLRSLDLVDATKNYGGGCYQMKPGDLIFFSSKYKLNALDHIGIVTDVQGDNIVTVEGNYSNSVKKRIINKNDKYVCGFGRVDTFLK